MSHKKKDRKSKTPEKKEIRSRIIGCFNDNPSKAFNYKELSKKLQIEVLSARQLIPGILEKLVTLGILEEIYTGKYRLKSKVGYITGIIQLNNRGEGTVASEDIKEDVYISPSNLHHALHGDKAKIFLFARRNKNNVEGEVVEIIERAKTNFVGIVEISKNFAFMVADSRNMPYDIFIPLSKLNGASDGQKVIAQITEWTANAKNPFGEIIEVLGNAGEHETETHAILAEFDLPYRYPEDAERFAETIPEKISEEEICKRRDFREIPTFTIDPQDAKDFDDALSLKKLPGGNWEVGVHIADVTHYVHTDDILDKEALNRATSIYLADRVVPMLPEKLSNHICSLRPHEEKLCFSAVFEINDNTEVIKEWFGKTIINSDRRFTYEEAQEIIETGNGELSDEILTLNRLARIMRDRRFKNGAISFERTEVKFQLNEDGKPTGIYIKENKESNQLIEEFMLLANKQVAEKIGKVDRGRQARTFVYRVHDVPDPEKMKVFSKFIKRFGYTINLGSGIETSKSINSLLDNVQGKNEQDLIETLAIRSMAKAVYTTKNIGHYGLGFPYYTHFTSPIRRYPDMMVHRLLEKYLANGKSVNESRYEAMCKHSSEMEQLAEKAERASIKYKQVEFMLDKTGISFAGIISGVTEWGLYVEIIENKIEGMIPIRELEGDFFVLDEQNYRLVGKFTRKKYQLGDKLDIEVVKCNLPRRQLDFRIYSDKSVNPSGKKWNRPIKY
ncbi:MAG: ribonuclease R [Bacteroidia bacterium]|nr:ribonuclease R [Bacteroidia bacterium]